mmetsp:Transcript_50962/g.118391  ORF Transcript_50962/g.118391 Transcript_50962/m.118391 type:complete len:417 (+) Transcript_50962:107-1357(+)
MASQEEQSEIEQLQLSEKEEEFIGQCWDGIQDSGKLGMDGLGALCDTLGITMDVINLAVTGLCTDDLTVDCDGFILLMGRMLRSGALKLPQAGAGEGDGEGETTDTAKQESTRQGEEPETEDVNEMSKIKLSEKEEDYIAQCWDGVREKGRLDMTGLRALCETLGIAEEVINLAVTGLGDENCTMNRDDFMLLMGRLLRSGALKLSSGGEPEEEPNEPQARTSGTWMSAMAGNAEDEEGPADEATAKAATAAWIASMTVTDEDEEEAGAAKPEPAKTGMSAWMASMKDSDGEDVDEAEPVEPARTKVDGMAAWLAASMNVEGEDVDEDEPTHKAGMEAWMASMVPADGEDVDAQEGKAVDGEEQEGEVPAVKGGDASAWLASMVGDDNEDADEALAPKLATVTNAWMTSMVESGEA